VDATLNTKLLRFQCLFPFFFDTGASDVRYLYNWGKFLIKQGLLSNNDFLGKTNSTNGDIVGRD
jgi:hypothetical protein